MLLDSMPSQNLKNNCQNTSLTHGNELDDKNLDANTIPNIKNCTYQNDLEHHFIDEDEDVVFL